MATGYIGFKGIDPEERGKLCQALREAHFTVEVVDDYVLVQGDDIVPVVEIYRRTCRKQADVFHVHLTDEELAEVEREIVSGEPSAKTRQIAESARVRVARFYGLSAAAGEKLVIALTEHGYTPALSRGTVFVEYRKDHEIDLKLLVERVLSTTVYRRLASKASGIFLN